MADQFIDVPITVNEEDLADIAIENLQSRWAGWEPNDGDLEVIMIETIASMAADAAAAAAQVPSAVFQTFGSALAGVGFQEGTYATALLEFTLADTDGAVIPEGFEVAVDGYAFVSDQEVTVAPGALTVQIEATAGEIGTEYNGLTGAVVTPVTASNRVDHVTLVEPTGGGADEEDEDDYLNRLSLAMELRGVTLVTTRDFELMALTEESSVTRVVATHLGARAVRVVGIDADGANLTAGVKARLQTLYAAYRMVNTTVTISDPTRTDVNVTYTVKAYPGYDGVALEDSINGALSDLLSPANWGRPPGQNESSVWYNEPRVRALKLVDEIGDIPGVDYVVSITLSASGVTPEANGDLILPGTTPLPEPGTMNGTIT